VTYLYKHTYFTSIRLWFIIRW